MLSASMSFNVFLTYSMNPDEQSLVWRLQTLATAQGIHMYVPARQLPMDGGAVRRNGIRKDVRTAIDGADCVLAIITANAGAEVQGELDYALSQNKLILPIAEVGVGNPGYFRRFPRVFSFSPQEPPDKVEREVVDFLSSRKLNKEQKQTMGAVVAIGVGMLVLNALSRE
jgi:hypothetical protein